MKGLTGGLWSPSWPSLPLPPWSASSWCAQFTPVCTHLCPPHGCPCLPGALALWAFVSWRPVAGPWAPASASLPVRGPRPSRPSVKLPAKTAPQDTPLGLSEGRVCPAFRGHIPGACQRGPCKDEYGEKRHREHLLGDFSQKQNPFL